MEQVSHPEKILFPEAGLSKEALARYFQRIAPDLLPHVRDRPLTMKRYPKGIGEKGFFNKHAPEHFEQHLSVISVPMRSEEGSEARMATAGSVADLVYLAGQNVIELHQILATAPEFDSPDQLVFDLDPSGDDFRVVAKVAKTLHRQLSDLGLPVFLKSSGSRGVHLHVPLRPEETFASVKPLARRVAEHLVEALPNEATLEHRKQNRGGKVFIDYLRNDYGQTCIVPYGPRALPGAPIAATLTWEDLDRRGFDPQRFTIHNIFRRRARMEEPWKRFNQRRIAFRTLEKAVSRL